MLAECSLSDSERKMFLEKLFCNYTSAGLENAPLWRWKPQHSHPSNSFPSNAASLSPCRHSQGSAWKTFSSSETCLLLPCCRWPLLLYPLSSHLPVMISSSAVSPLRKSPSTVAEATKAGSSVDSPPFPPVLHQAASRSCCVLNSR